MPGRAEVIDTAMLPDEPRPHAETGVRPLPSGADIGRSLAHVAQQELRPPETTACPRRPRPPNVTHFVSGTALAASGCIEERWKKPAASALPLTDQSESE